MRLPIFLSLLLLSLNAVQAQKITAIWKGHFTVSQNSYYPSSSYKYEVQLLEKSGVIEGVTYSYQDTRFYGKAAMSGSFSKKSEQIVFKETKMLELKIANGTGACIMTCYLKLVTSGKEQFLEGTYTSKSVNDSSDCGRGTVFLRKVYFSDFQREAFLTNPLRDVNAGPDPRDRLRPTPSAPKEKTPSTAKNAPAPIQKSSSANAQQKQQRQSSVPETDSTKATFIPPPRYQDDKMKSVPTYTPPPPVLVKRENVLVSTITVKIPELTIKFYDNGEVDNDSISVYNNNKLILSGQRLSTKPIVLKINLNETGGTADLVMVADNLGTIPPNTALMIVEAGDFRKEVHISSNLQQNARVKFKLKP